MSNAHFKIRNANQIHFITIAGLEGWIPLQRGISDVLLDSIRYHQSKRIKTVWLVCVMSDHVNLLASASMKTSNARTLGVVIIIEKARHKNTGRKLTDFHIQPLRPICEFELLISSNQCGYYTASTVFIQ